MAEKKPLTLDDVAQMLEDVQANLEKVLDNQTEILEKLDNINTYGPDFEIDE